MADEQGKFAFANLGHISRGSFTLSAGTKPSVATIEVPALTNYVPAVGMLRITFGSTVISFPDCKPSEAVLRRGREGWIWTISLLDRRWKWEFGPISGHYNERTRQGTFLKSTIKKTPRELAAICFEAMGEANYDLSLLPNENFPQVNWDVIYSQTALSDLLEKSGCRIVLRTDNVAKIYPIGQGASLPTIAVMNDSFTFDPPEKPDILKFFGAPTKYQAKFVLEAVGRDTDGKVQLIDSLSYKPAAGWMTPGIFSEVTDSDNRALAQNTVFRWYRVKGMLNGGSTLTIPNLATLDSIDDVVLLDEQVVTVEDPQTGEQKPKAPFVTGTHAGPEFFQKNTASTARPQVSFRVVPDTNMIEFAEPIWIGGTTSGVTGATDLKLETAFLVKDSQTRSLKRFELDRSLGGVLGTKARIVKHDEILLTKRAEYVSTNVTGVVTNDVADQVTAFAGRYLDAAAAEYQTLIPEDRSFAGIFDISPDGAIAQVTWSVGRDGATTRASRGNEHSVLVPNYEQRERTAKIKAVFQRPIKVEPGGIAEVFARSRGLPIK